jgi:PAS domain S-box-containing protein
LVSRFPIQVDRSHMTQIRMMHASLKDLMGELEETDGLQALLLRQIRSDYTELDNALEEIISFPLEPGSGPVSAERYNVLSSQLLLMSQFISDNARQMAKITREDIHAAQQRTGVLILILIVALTFINLIISFFSGRNIMRTEGALQESEKRFRMATNAAEMGIFVRDLQAGKDYWSPEFLALYGCGPDGPLPLRDGIPAVVHPDDFQEIAASRDEFYGASLPEFSSEHRIVLPDGRLRWVMVRGKNEFDARGKPTLTHGLAMDITERKQAEEALRENVATLKAVLETLPVGIVIVDAEGRVVRDNAATRELWGVPPETTSWEQYSEWVAWWPETGERIQAHEWAVARALLKGEESYGELIQNQRFGSQERRYFLNNAVPLRNDQGRITGGVVAMLDVTDRLAAEQELRRSEALYRSIAQNFPEGAIYVFDHDLRFLVADGQALKTMGYTREGLEGKTIWEATDPETCRILEQRYPRVLSGESLHFETQLKGWVFSSSYVPVRDAHGKIIAGMVVSQDITERKKAEQALHHLNETLERQVAERTELAEARAKQLQSLAVELIEAEEKERWRISELLHEDLQQILAGARMQLQPACAKAPPEWLLDNVDRLLEHAIEKSRSLSQDLGPAVLHTSGLAFSLNWLAVKMSEKSGLFTELAIRSEPQFLSEPLKVFIFRAVQELLFNVAGHSGVKKAHVALSVIDNSISVSVIDAGLGFDPAVLDVNIPSAQSGLGLLSLRERANYIGGRLDIESAPGQGSRITLTVPIITSNHPLQLREEAEAKDTIAPAANDSRSTGDLKVLFVDPHEVMRRVLIKLVSDKPDIQIVGEASNALASLEIARQKKPDVVVMDVSMSEIECLEAIRSIKTALPHARVIGLLMYEDEPLARTMRQAGVECIVGKTASSHELLKAIYGANRQPSAREEK